MPWVRVPDDYIPVPYNPFWVPRKKYGFFNFVLDISMILLTGGLWMIWIIIREIRNS